MTSRWHPDPSRESQLIQLVAQGLSDGEICVVWGLPATSRSMIYRLRMRLGLRSKYARNQNPQPWNTFPEHYRDTGKFTAAVRAAGLRKDCFRGRD